MMNLVVYADILITVNVLVDFFLLSASSVFLRKKIKLLRLVIAAIIGGISSLYIFIPKSNTFFEMAYKIFVCLIMAAVSFGFNSLKMYIKSSLTVFGITCIYGGIMIALWHIFKPYGMVINNSVVYFNISPEVLIASTLFFYFLFFLLSKIFSYRSKSAARCNVKLFADGVKAEVTAIIDTGNSACDSFGLSEIIIADSSVKQALFGEKTKENSEKMKKRYRLVPCATVGGTDVLEGYRCDRAVIEAEGKITEFEKPILATSKLNFNGDYKAIVNPEIFN